MFQLGDPMEDKGLVSGQKGLWLFKLNSPRYESTWLLVHGEKLPGWTYDKCLWTCLCTLDPQFCLSGPCKRCGLGLNLHSGPVSVEGTGTTDYCQGHCIPGMGLSLPLPCPWGLGAEVRGSLACAAFLP